MLFDNVAFAEQLVKCQKSVKNTLLRVLSIVGFLVLFIGISIVMSMFMTGDLSTWRNFIGGVIAVVGVFGVYMAFRYTDLEYEYSFLDGDMDVIKIYGKSRRKKYFSFSASSVSAVGRLDEKNRSAYSGDFVKKYDVTSGAPGTDKWFVALANDTGRRMLMVFEPNEKMLEAMRRSVNKRLFLD